MNEDNLFQDLLPKEVAEMHLDSDHGKPSHITKFEDSERVTELLPHFRMRDIHQAVALGLKSFTESLLKDGIDIESRNNLRQTPLHVAAENDDDTMLLLLLRYGAIVEAKDTDDWTPLHLSTMMGKEANVLLLLEFGAYVNPIDKYGCTPLHYAVEKDNSIILLLLDNGAIIEAKDPNYRTPLHFAVLWENNSAISVLVEHGAYVNAIDKNRRTPLHLATKYKSTKMLTVLLQFGADVNKIDETGWTALHIAAHLGYYELVIILCKEGADVNQSTILGYTPLYLASQRGDVKMVYLLLELSADTEKADLNGWTPLYIASSNANLDIISVLLEYKENTDTQDANLRSPLKEATEDRKIHQVSTLMQKRAIYSRKTKSINSILHVAAENHNLEVMKTVLTIGANINAVNRDGHTVLHIAASLGHADMVSFLLENGATMGGDTDEPISHLTKFATEAGRTHILEMGLGYQTDMKQNEKYPVDMLHTFVVQGNVDKVSLLLKDVKLDLENLDSNGMTPLFSAADHPEMVALLVDNNANMNASCKQRNNITVLHHYVQMDKSKALHVLLNCGCNIEAIDNKGNTPLHYAVSRNNSAAVELLVKRGVNMEIRNKYGRTAFHTAVECDSLRIVELLINFDININAVIHGIKATPLQCAIQRNNLSMIQLLLDHNVRVNAKGDAGDTALHTAVRTGKDIIVSMLLQQNVRLNARNLFGATPLDLALRDGNIVISGLLIKAGAESDSQFTTYPLSQSQAQSNQSESPTLNQRLREEKVVANWLKWISGDTIQNFENVGYSDAQSLSAIEDEYNHGLPLFKESTYQDDQDSDEDDPSLLHVRFNESSRPQTPSLSEDRSSISSMMESEELGGELSDSIYDVAAETTTYDFNQILDRTTSKWASKVMEYLIEWCGVTLYYNESLFVLKLNNKPDGPSPPWAAQFNKMSIIREPGLLAVPRPKQKTYLSIPGWFDHKNLLIRFINAVCVCRMSSPKVSSQVFSEVLGCLEENISLPLRGTLIAGLAVTSMIGGYNNADMLVKAILSVYSETALITDLTRSKDQRELHERKCHCGSSHEHRPLSPVAAAKAVGIAIWNIRKERRILPRVWDLHSDTLVNSIDIRQVYFISHRWSENGEIEYKDIMEKSSSEDNVSAEVRGISTYSKKLERIRSVIVKHARYVWIDTICMDRSSLSDLDETDRSMYKWYANCRAVVLDSDTSLNVWKSRGWCLQEGAAAGLLYGILAKDSREELVSLQELAEIQNVHLCQLDLSLYYRPGNAAEILARMDARKTTNVEDMSYALIGIFSLNIPLGYGEGWDARTKVLNRLATMHGDISFLSFATTRNNSGKYLPLPKDKIFSIAQCISAKISTRISHIGLTVEAQLVNIVEFQSVLNRLKRWKKLQMNRTKSVGLDQLITAAEQRDVRNSERIEVAIVHRIRSLMLLEINGAEQHMGRQEYKSYHRLQCCQFEHYEFERLFSDFNAQYQTIRLGDKPLIGESAQDAQKRKVEKLLPLNLFRSAEWPTTPRFPYHRAPSSNSAEHFFRLEKNRHRKTHPLLGLSKSVDNVEKSSFRQKSTINHSLSISNEDSENSDPEDDEYRTTKPIRNWHYTESSNVADNNRNCHILELVSKHQYLLSDVVEAIIAIGAALNDDSVQTLEIRHAQHDNNHPSPVKLVATIFHYVLLNSELANNIFTTAKKSETSLRHALYEVHGDDNTLASRVGTLHYRLYEMMKDVLMSEETTIPDHNVEIINTPILLAFLEVYCRPELREFQNKMRTCTDRVPLSTKLMTTVYAKHYSLTGLVDNHIEITSEVHNGDSILPTDIVHVNGDRELLDKLDTKGIVAIKMSTELVKGNISDVYMLAKKQNDSYHCLLYCTLTPGAVAFLKLLGSERKNIVVAGIWENPNPIIPYYPCKKCGVVPNAVSIVTDLDQVGNSILASVYHYSTPGNISVRIDCGQNLKEISLSQRLKCMTVSENDLFVISLNRLMDGYKHGTIPIIPYDQEFHICDEMIAFALLPPAYREATIKLCFAKDAVHIYPDQNFAYLKEIKEGESSDHTRWLVKKVHMYRETVKDLASRESDAAESLENRVKQVIAIVKAATKGVPFVDMGSAAEVATLKWKKKVGDRNRYEVTEKLRTIHAELVAEANFSAVSMLLSYRFNSDFAKSAFTGEYMCFLGSENDFTGPMPPYYKFRVYQLALIGVIYTWRKYGQNIEISAQSINHDDKTRKVAYLNDSGDIHVSSAFEFGKVGESMMTEHIVGNLSASSTHNDIHNRNIPRACNLESFGLFTRFIIIMKRRFKKKRDQMWRQEL